MIDTDRMPAHSEQQQQQQLAHRDYTEKQSQQSQKRHDSWRWMGQDERDNKYVFRSSYIHSYMFYSLHTL